MKKSSSCGTPASGTPRSRGSETTTSASSSSSSSGTSRSLPAANTLDRATAHLPRLLHERLGDLGIDFAILYPSRTLTTTAIQETEVRQLACRVLNEFCAEVYRPYADRLTPVAQIPTHTPEEAIAALEHAVGLGFKAILVNGNLAMIGDHKQNNWKKAADGFRSY